MNLKTAVSNWQTFQGAGKKLSTQQYHGEIAKIILDRWPDHEQEVLTVTETQLADFLPLVAHFSAPRFNAVVSALKKIFPAQGRFLRLRRVTVKERAPLSQLQFSRLLAELDERPQSHGGLVIRFLAYTGLRINEARQLRWSDVRRDCIVLPGKFSKNGRPRHVPFVPGLGDVLDALRRVSGAELVLPQGEVKRALQTACRLAGVPRLSHHDFRHLFATRCIESGVDMPTAARWLGHQDGGALLGRVYFHLADRHSREMAARVSI